MKGVKKQHLPEKVCLTCGRPFTWRKKWERAWDEVKFCSDWCRMRKPAPGSEMKRPGGIRRTPTSEANGVGTVS